MDDVTHLTGHCPQCSRPLAPDAPQGLCVSCLLMAGMETLTVGGDDQATLTSTVRGVTAAGVGGQSLTIGERWGDYRIGRLLGRGGMGEVYEAEQVATGRRLALKVLRSRLHSPDDRARFLREGQLAASVSHPHTVYIFGSDEIAGMPVITMELLPGGTLKDRIVAGGPMPVTQAVAAILDIIGGLDAAQASGILHRDIKPSNCFIDRDGTVKVGDFGLSISTLARDVREDVVSEGFQGTPQFAAPEQLRGEPLDVRADIYAVGATLYYLLTGRPPFEAHDLRDLVTRVTTAPAPSPRTLRSEIPSGLATVVTRCLAKTAVERPPTYAALAEMLRPFAASQDAPAPLTSRFGAYAFDYLVLMVPVAILSILVANTAGQSLIGRQATVTWTWSLSFAYFLLLESVWGASLGKRLLGLWVVAASRAAWWRIPLRTALFMAPGAILITRVLPFDAVQRSTEDSVRLVTGQMMSAAMFSFARARNGWASWPDLATGTRVVVRRAAPTSRVGRTRAVPAAVDAIAPKSGDRAYGPYQVMSDAGATDRGRLWIALDPVLRRRVWIHAVPDDTPPVDAARRDVARAGRLYWLAGRRAPGDSWDAFEAPDGQPLAAFSGAPLWATHKLWLLDVASELVAGARDGTLPDLSFDRLWLRDDGRVLLLDFRSPSAGNADPQQTLSPPVLLGTVAGHVLRLTAGVPVAMALSARELLKRLAAAPADPGPSNASDQALLGTALLTLTRLSTGPDTLPRRRRLLPVSMTAAPLVLALGGSLAVLPSLAALLSSDVDGTLGWLSRLSQPLSAGSRLTDPEVRAALEQYVAGRYRGVLTNDALWNSEVMQSEQLSPLRRTALDLRRRYPSVSAEDLARATILIAPEIEQVEARRRLQAERRGRAGILAAGGNIIVSTVTAVALVLLVLASLLSAAILPGGVMTRVLGLAVVRRDGSEVGRGRSLLRALVMWLPGLAWLVYLAMSPRIQVWVPAPTYPLAAVALSMGLMTAGAIWTTVARIRGPHDWIVGTWVTLR